MASTDYDVIIGGTKAKVARNEDGGYRRRTLRREVEQQLLSQSETPALVSRADLRQLYQKSWAGGSRWWKPLLGAQELDSYFQSNHMDVWSEPGKIVPMNKLTESEVSNIGFRCVVATGENGKVYAIGRTDNVNASFWDVYKWTPASDAFVQETGYHSGVDDSGGDPAYYSVYDPTDDYIYVYTFDDDISRFDAEGSAQDDEWINGSEFVWEGSNIFLTQEGIVVYNGDILRIIDKSTPEFEEIFDDGLGRDFLSNRQNDKIAPNSTLAVGTPQGIYYVKNISKGGQPQPWVFRVDKDASGSWVGNPIATLPTGTLALDIAFHLGQVVISTTPNYGTIVADSTPAEKNVEVVFYFVGEGGMGAIGSPLGGRDELDETPYKILASEGPLLYIAGQKRLWVYDAVRGGLHTVHEWDTELADAPYNVMFWATNSAGNAVRVFVGPKGDSVNVMVSQQEIGTDDPDTVTNFGDDEDYYVVESNYFDAGLPMEEKELTKVTIALDPVDGDQEWTVQISADDGSFTDALTHSTANNPPIVESNISPGTTGYLFRYVLIYQTKDTSRYALRGLMVTFATGEMVTEWDLTLDGDELLNVDNELQDEQAFYDALKTIADTKDITTLVDNMQEQGQETDDGTTINVRVQAVEISKTKPGESVIRVVLRET